MDNIDIINIKNIKLKYDIYLNKLIDKIENINIYEGKNLLNKKKIIIEVYTLEILCFAKRVINKIIKLEHKNLINIIDIIIDNSNIYFIKEYNNTTLLDVEFNINYIKELISCIQYLFENNIYIENLKIKDIFIINNTIKISPIFIESKPNKKILYGSPLFSPQNNICFLKNEKEELIIKNIATIIQIYTNIHSNVVNDIKYYNLIKNLFFNKISFDEFINQINKYIYITNIKQINNDELFFIEL
jgi:hypothetical protein